MDAETSVRKEYNDINSKDAWPSIYQDIRKECLKFDYSAVEAKKLKNKNLNRYRDVSPYDHTRIILKKGTCDYINANIVKMEEADRQYILTQGPLPNTTDHFWLMVWEQNCSAVIMLNRIIEKDQVKCHQYWPMGSNKGGENQMLFTEALLKVEFVSEIEASYYIKRVLRLTELESGDSREILHFHYTTWPDFGVPQSPTAFLYFLAEVRRSGALSPNVGPPVVHCSAGIGRSGTFCLVDSCLVMIKERKDCEWTSVRDVLLEMRRHRMGLIQTVEQLRFSYLAIIEGLKDDWESVNDNEVSTIEVNANHCATVEDEPPPLPPPRGESLAIQVNLRPLPPLPSESPSTSSSSPVSSRSSSPENETENGPLIDNRNEDGLRQRQTVAEKQKKTAERVAEMKRKQKAAESWARLKRARREGQEEDEIEDGYTNEKDDDKQ
ncbi:tyrosine-protein phosphatase non-receptor type 1-like isoform X2 [Lycorma delicatula]|uniref:tyrosine-protein phosphatase non-receptor type 1-like isoform X2 n=1 Tax=Lycorma delicatula TaxID=130591 RepID=UPI003F515EC7